MKKIGILVLFVSLFINIQSVSAAEITNSTFDNNKITLNGTGDTQVQIVLFDLNNSPLYMTTASVENGKFSITLPEIAKLSSGNYIIKVADYNGKNVDSREIAVSNNKITNISNPKTSDGITKYFILGIIGFSGIAGIVIYNKKKKYN